MDLVTDKPEQVLSQKWVYLYELDLPICLAQESLGLRRRLRGPFVDTLPQREAAFNFFGGVFWVRGAALVSMETSEGRTVKATGHSLTRRRPRPRMGAAVVTSKRSAGTAAPTGFRLLPSQSIGLHIYVGLFYAVVHTLALTMEESNTHLHFGPRFKVFKVRTQDCHSFGLRI